MKAPAKSQAEAPIGKRSELRIYDELFDPRTAWWVPRLPREPKVTISTASMLPTQMAQSWRLISPTAKVTPNTPGSQAFTSTAKTEGCTAHMVFGGGVAGHCGSCEHFGVGPTPKMSEKTLWLASDSRHLHQGVPAVLRSTPSPPHTRQLPRALCAPCSSLVSLFSLFSSESRQISVTFMAKSKN